MDYNSLVEIKKSEVWMALHRLIVNYDHSFVLNNIIPHTSAFWKIQEYEFDKKHGLNIVKPQIKTRIFEMRTRIINYMRESYELEDYDFGIWPTSPVSYGKRTRGAT